MLLVHPDDDDDDDDDDEETNQSWIGLASMAYQPL